MLMNGIDLFVLTKLLFHKKIFRLFRIDTIIVAQKDSSAVLLQSGLGCLQKKAHLYHWFYGIQLAIANFYWGSSVNQSYNLYYMQSNLD